MSLIKLMNLVHKDVWVSDSCIATKKLNRSKAACIFASLFCFLFCSLLCVALAGLFVLSSCAERAFGEELEGRIESALERDASVVGAAGELQEAVGTSGTTGSVGAVEATGSELNQTARGLSPDGPSAFTVRTVRVERVSEAPILESTGSTAHIRRVQVLSPGEGSLVHLALTEGERVAKGQLLAQIHNPQLQLLIQRQGLQVQSARSSLQLSELALRDTQYAAEARILSLEVKESEFEQKKNALAEQERRHEALVALSEVGAVSDESLRASGFAVQQQRAALAIAAQELEIFRIGLREQDVPAPEGQSLRDRRLQALCASAVADLEASRLRVTEAELELEIASLSLERLTLRSSSSGVLVGRYAEEGQYLKPNDPLFTILDDSQAHVVFSLSESNAALTANGQRAMVSIASLAGQWPAELEYVSPLADGSGGFLSRLRIIDAPEGLKSGMFARFSLFPETEEAALALPESALSSFADGSARVFSLSGYTVHERRISVGEARNGLRIVHSGLEEGELVVDAPHPALREGDRVSL
jgi:multidrug efflux pump subunit AcrA (membrane-fusion protein)